MENKFRVINTARSEEAINKAVANGYWPLVKPVVPSPEIKIKYAVLQDKATGNISVIHDFRDDNYTLDIKPIDSLNAFGEIDDITSVDDKELPNNTVIPFTFYYPHQFESPYAAYLIPSDIVIGETVILMDLIEDVVSGKWNQGDTFRLQSSEAIWTGIEFILSPQALNRMVTVG
jgi:hypothetical protein